VRSARREVAECEAEEERLAGSVIDLDVRIGRIAEGVKVRNSSHLEVAGRNGKLMSVFHSPPRCAIGCMAEYGVRAAVGVQRMLHPPELFTWLVRRRRKGSKTLTTP
jgi:hypothetical protein